MEPVQPGKDAAQASPFGHKTGKADWKETQRKDTKNIVRITSLSDGLEVICVPRSKCQKNDIWLVLLGFFPEQRLPR